MDGALILNNMIMYSQSLWATVQPILSSPTFIAAFMASILAPYFAITTYLKQQRVSRIQRIYYEESLLGQLKHIDRVIDATSKNLSYFENAMNLILNEQRAGGVTEGTITLLGDIANKIESPTRYHSSNREILIILFKKYGYIIHQWLFKFDHDFVGFNLFLRELVFNLAARLRQSNLTEENIRNQGREVDNTFNLVMRHYTFAYLFNQIVSRVGILDFKSQDDLINDIAKDKIIKSTLVKIDATFKILFGYFKIEKNSYLSFLKDENGNRFKFNIDNQITVERVNEAAPEEHELRIIKNDMQLASAVVEVNGSSRSYSMVQIGIANLCAFNEKPNFYPEVESFNHF